MQEDKQRWNERYLDNPMPQSVSPLLEKYISHAKVGQAVDVACGTGRNTHFLANLGFLVDAVDISDYALDKVKNSAMITKIDADLDKYNLAPNRYDLIVDVNYYEERIDINLRGEKVKVASLVAKKV